VMPLEVVAPEIAPIAIPLLVVAAPDNPPIFRPVEVVPVDVKVVILIAWLVVPVPDSAPTVIP